MRADYLLRAALLAVAAAAASGLRGVGRGGGAARALARHPRGHRLFSTLPSAPSVEAPKETTEEATAPEEEVTWRTGLPPRLGVAERRALWTEIHERQFELAHARLRGRPDVAAHLVAEIIVLRRSDAYIVLDARLDAALKNRDIEAAMNIQAEMVLIGAPPIDETKVRRPWGKPLIDDAELAAIHRAEYEADFGGSDGFSGGAGVVDGVPPGGETSDPALVDRLAVPPVHDMLHQEFPFPRLGGAADMEAQPAVSAGTEAQSKKPASRLDRWLEGLAKRTLALGKDGDAEAAPDAAMQRRPPAVKREPLTPTLHKQLRKGSIRVSTSSKGETQAVQVHARAIYLKKELFGRAKDLPLENTDETSRRVADFLKSLKPPSPKILADPSTNFFLFRFRVTNNNEYPVRIHQACWEIESAGGSIGEVTTDGPALPKQVLHPGETMEFAEACALQLPPDSSRAEAEGVRGDLARSVYGRTSGAFRVQAEPQDDGVFRGNGEEFDAAIHPFYLVKKAELPW
mmetsp:Transcript_6201/g.17307  ORF Transcript_6201/g.17307 Transcript_6201/m.17307 type:complete len:516 (-) Transcript_6201:466-2013(-)